MPAEQAPPGWYPPVAPPVAQPYGQEMLGLIEPALMSVLPAILGLLQLSELLLRQGPAVIDMPGPEPTEFTPGEPSAMSFGLGHIGLFGTADAGRTEPDPGAAQG